MGKSGPQTNTPGTQMRKSGPQTNTPGTKLTSFCNFCMLTGSDVHVAQLGLPVASRGLPGASREPPEGSARGDCWRLGSGRLCSWVPKNYIKTLDIKNVGPDIFELEPEWLEPNMSGLVRQRPMRLWPPFTAPCGPPSQKLRQGQTYRQV